MKENISEDNDKEKLLIENLGVQVEKTKPKKKFNYKIRIAIYSILDLVCFILFLIFFLRESYIFLPFLASFLFFTYMIILEIFIVFKMKRDKKERELPIELKKIEDKKNKKKLNEMKKKMLDNQQKMREKKTGLNNKKINKLMMF